MQRSVKKINDLCDLSPESWPQVMKAARRVFKKDNRYGIFAMAIGLRRVRGIETKHLTLVTYIERKERSPGTPIPPVEFDFERRRYRMKPDVVATGRRLIGHDGQRLLFTGLHPGAQIVADLPGARSIGAVALLLETKGNPEYLVTAGHLFPTGSEGLIVKAASYTDPRARGIGNVLFNLLDGAVPGVRPDVAVVKLTPEGVRMAEESSADPRAPRFSGVVPTAELAGLEAQAYLPIEQQYSPVVVTQPRPFTGYMDSPLRPGGYEVTDVLETNHQMTHGGDSGTALFSSLHPMMAIGSCVGAIPNQSSLFEVFDRSLRIVRQVIGVPIRLWHGDYFGGDG